MYVKQKPQTSLMCDQLNVSIILKFNTWGQSENTARNNIFLSLICYLRHEN